MLSLAIWLGLGLIALVFVLTAIRRDKKNDPNRSGAPKKTPSMSPDDVFSAAVRDLIGPGARIVRKVEPETIATDASYVYIAQAAERTVSRQPKNGGARRVLARGRGPVGS